MQKAILRCGVPVPECLEFKIWNLELVEWSHGVVIIHVAFFWESRDCNTDAIVGLWLAFEPSEFTKHCSLYDM